MNEEGLVQMERTEIEKRILYLEQELNYLKGLTNSNINPEAIKSIPVKSFPEHSDSDFITYNFLNSIIEHSPNSMWISDKHGTLIRLNKACRNILQINDEDVVGKYNILKDTNLEEQGVMPLVRNVFEKGEFAHFSMKYDTSLVKDLDLKQSVKLFLHVNISPIFDIYGNVSNAIIQHVDLTKRKEIEDVLAEREEKLKQLNFDKDRFISILAHDLISPFNPILGILELLKENLENYEIDKVKSMIKNVYNSTQNVFNLLDETLIWAKSQSGKIVNAPQTIKFDKIYSELLEFLKPAYSNKNISIELHADPDLMVFADKDILKTVLRNLVTNAIKFTSRGGVIKIYCKQNYKETIFTVSDNGIGIQPENLAKMLDNKLYTTLGTASEKGAGLGLLICQEFVEKLGGKISVFSEFGIGTTFTFSIPNDLTFATVDFQGKKAQ